MPPFSRADKFVGVKISRRRGQLGMSLKQLSDASGIPEEELATYEKGEARMTPKQLLKLAEVLRVSLSYLFDDT